MVHEHLIAEDLQDLRIDSDRQVQVGGSGDLELTHGVETVNQSIVLESGSVLRALIGEPLTAEAIGDVQETLRRSLDRDPQLSSVRRVVIREINNVTNTIDIEIFVDFNNSFTVEAVL